MNKHLPLDGLTVKSLLRAKDGSALRCAACARRCRLEEGAHGACGVRFASGGELLVPYGYVSALACDPVEKKPFYHVLPGSGALSFGMLGCNFSCRFCQNYSISQARDPEFFRSEVTEISATDIVSAAVKCKAKLLVSTYNEPLISLEWAADIFKTAGPEYIRAFVSNGYATPEAVEYIKPHINAYKVDLKCFSDSSYRAMTGGTLQPVLDTIALLHKSGIWVEVVTLLVPGFNDSPSELKDMAQFLKSVSPDLPWHITAFHPEYKLQDRHATTAKQLFEAVETGKNAGLNFVYAGNISGHDFENTNCPKCGKTLVERKGYTLIGTALKLEKNGTALCGHCSATIPGIWQV